MKRKKSREKEGYSSEEFLPRPSPGKSDREAEEKQRETAPPVCWMTLSLVSQRTRQREGKWKGKRNLDRRRNERKEGAYKETRRDAGRSPQIHS